ncbi:hypothetical protein [Micromonospora marina]|uniref:hypothetical protein n=1 Tax=Micromonospora marina TaxID=307120 RepID=UPI003454011E
MSDPVADGPARRRRPGSSPSRTGRLVALCTVLGVVIALVALVRDVAGFEIRPEGGSTVASIAPSTGGRTTATPAPNPVGQPDRTSLGDLTVVAGLANLGTLPRSLGKNPGFDRAVVIDCPSNAAADRHRDITFQLRRGYLDFEGTVRPHFTDPSMRDAKAFIYAQVSIKERDGTITRLTRGSQFEARMATPMVVRAELEGADELTLRVECQFPNGQMIITDAWLTPS